MQQLKVLVPVPRLTVYTDMTLPQLGVKFLAPTAPPDVEIQEDVSPKSDEIRTLAFVDGALEENLSETITALSGVDESDFCKYTTMEFPIESDLFRMRASTRANDEELLNDIIEHADRRLDGLRLDYCRLDKPQMCFGIPGYIHGKNKFAVFVFDPASDDGRMIAREPEVPVTMPGIGLDLESIHPSSVDSLITEEFATDALGGRLKRLLRTYATALSATSDESKILTIVFALDGILTPEKSWTWEFKEFIGVSASMKSADFQGQYDRFCKFYDEVRNPLVHHGRSYSDLRRDRKSDLLYLQSLVAGLLKSMVPFAHESFDEHWDGKMVLAKTWLSKRMRRC